MKFSPKKVLRWVIGGGLLLALAAVGFNSWIVCSTSSALYRETVTLPENPVALVLGTGKLLRSGRENPHFRARCVAAAELFRAGKVKHLLLSGDNHVAGYDEPSDMKASLLALGLPESAITLDYAGFRTLDSVVRARKIFGQTRLTIVTDDFHAARAVFLARHSGVDAVAFCSVKIPANFSARSRVREVGARVKAVLDVFVLHTRPKFLGAPVSIALAQRD